jgi:hypothetical protein
LSVDAGSNDSPGDDESSESAGSAQPQGGAARPRLAELLPSDAMLASLHLMHQRGILKSRSHVGGALMGAGLGLAAFGGILMATSSVEYARLAEEDSPTDQAAALYAASMAMLASGGALSAVGIPLLAKAESDLRKLAGLERSLAARPAPRLELMASGIRLRF